MPKTASSDNLSKSNALLKKNVKIARMKRILSTPLKDEPIADFSDDEIMKESIKIMKDARKN